MSNAERQKLHRQRLRERASSGVTPEDVVRAAKLIFDSFDPVDVDGLTWEEWLAKARRKGNRGMWADILPEHSDPEYYEEFSPEAASLLIRVAAVVRATRHPPIG
jgi:hypothetical protein